MTEFDSVTGMPVVPAHMFWRVEKSFSYDHRYGYEGYDPQQNGWRISLLERVNYPKQTRKRVFLWWHKTVETEEMRHQFIKSEVVPCAEWEKDEKGALVSSKLLPLTPDRVREAAVNVWNAYQSDVAQDGLLGDYPPKSLL